MRRVAWSLAFAVAMAGMVSAVALARYDGHAALTTFEILAPLGCATVLVAHGLALGRERVGSLRRQFAVVSTVAVVQLVAAVVLFVDQMFVSGHDAFFAVLAAVYATALTAWAVRLLGRRALDDVDAVRATLTGVGQGRRDVRTGVRGRDEIARLAADVDAMVARLEDEERARRSLIAAVSHDLRTPITALRLLADAIDDEVADAETRREYAARIGTHVRALGALIDDLFELTRLESGDLTWTMERVRVDTLLHEAVEAMRPAAEAQEVSVTAELDAEIAAARANPEKLQRELFNLLQNAIRHTPPDGSVTVRAESVGGGIEIEVADTGSGIDGEHRTRVFEPFYRADGSRSDGGAGLGLAVSRAIVEAHGGTIWLEEAPVGARVRFRLPSGDGAGVA
ncbi:MAG: two-component system, OmpR family, sensor kinase [Solirubrobacteraceae bacterium]